MKKKYTNRQRTGLFLGLPIFILVLLLPAPPDMPPAAQRVLAVTVLMAFWWLTEALPLPVTALVPIALFPLLNVLPTQAVTAQFGNRNIFLFMGGFFLAAAIEKWDLHRRMALSVVMVLGTSPPKIVLGMMTATAFLSMWISNTATAVMMLPIAIAIIKSSDSFTRDHSSGHMDSSHFATSLMLGIGYAASIGGIGTLIGTPPNIIFAAQVQKLFPGAPEISFFRWFLVGFPLVLIFLPLSWVYLVKFMHPSRLESLPGGRKLIQQELRQMGVMRRGEKGVLVIFCLTAFAWIFRQTITIGPFHIPGWSNLLGIENMVHDASVAIVASVLLFIIPENLKRGRFLLDWRRAVRIPWGILLLFGGGLALAHAFQVSGLAAWFASRLTGLRAVPNLLMVLLVVLIIDFLTEVTSNTATASIFMPILAATSIAMGVHPYLLMIAGTIAASLAFMLPVATPPNAVIFGSGYISIPEMVRSGLGMNVLGMIITTVVVYLIAIPVFGIVLNNLPDWVR